MEVVGSGGRHNNAHVNLLDDVLVVVADAIFGNELVLVAKLQVTLSATRRVLRAGTVVTVRQKHHETVLNVPLGLTRADELIDDDLSAISKVTELRLPHGQRVRMSLRIAKLVAEDGEFRQVRVGGNELSTGTNLTFTLSTIVADNSGINRVVVTIAILIENMSMSVREGTSLDVLSRNTHVITFLDERSASERLSSTPVDVLTGLERLDTRLENPFNILVEVLRRESRYGETELFDVVKGQAGMLRSILIKLLDAFPLFGLPFLGLELVILRLSVSLLEQVIDL